MLLARFSQNGFRGLSNRAFSKIATPKLVKQLREMTGSPLKDCIKALEESNGDIDASKDYLRKKGLAMAEKKADRSATQGLVGIIQNPETARVTMI